MNEEERPTTLTVPTELDRADAFLDAAVLAGVVLLGWWLALPASPLHGLFWWIVPPSVLLAATWTLTGEPAGDVPFLGAVAAGLRSKLGLRRAHEWFLAFGHYCRVRVWPDMRAWWRAYIARHMPRRGRSP